MRVFRTLALGATMLAVVLGACSTGGGSKPTIKIGSDGFYEAKLMAEIYGQALEANGYTVNRDGIGLGARRSPTPALESGQIDLKPEYLGCGLAYYARHADRRPGRRTQTALQAILDAEGRRDHASSNYTPAQDQNAFVVRKDTADQFKLDEDERPDAPSQRQLKFGVATDCHTNPVCGAALKDAYGIDVANATKLRRVRHADGPGARSARPSTLASSARPSPTSSSNDLVVLQDDKQTQPADNIAPHRPQRPARQDRQGRVPKLLNDVSAKMDTATLTDLGKQIAVDKKDVAAVAKQWLKDNGFVKYRQRPSPTTRPPRPRAGGRLISIASVVPGPRRPQPRGSTPCRSAAGPP